MKPGRSKTVTVKCEYCGAEFEAIATRVKVGWGRFCSMSCKNKSRKISTIGKENAAKAFDKTKNAYYVYWNDPETLKRKTSTYARWWWEINKGEIPDGYRASYKDGNTTNISPENIVLHSPEEWGKAISERLMGHKLSQETREKISKGNTGKKIWTGIVTDQRYSNWSKTLKNQVKERDNYTCQICSDDLHNPKQCKIHHIDGNKHNSVPENLILLCTSCHALVHCKKSVSDKILELRAKLK